MQTAVISHVAAHVCRYVCIYIHQITVTWLYKIQTGIMFYLGVSYFVVFFFILKINLVHPTECFALLKRISVNIVIILCNVLGGRKDSPINQKNPHVEIPPFRFQLLFCLFFGFQKMLKNYNSYCLLRS